MRIPGAKVQDIAAELEKILKRPITLLDTIFNIKKYKGSQKKKKMITKNSKENEVKKTSMADGLKPLHPTGSFPGIFMLPNWRED